MSDATLKKEIHQALDRVSDLKALKVFHTMIIAQAEVDQNDGGSELTEEQWAEVEQRNADYVNGRVKYLTLEEFTKNIDVHRKKFIEKGGNISTRRRRD